MKSKTTRPLELRRILRTAQLMIGALCLLLSAPLSQGDGLFSDSPNNPPKPVPAGTALGRGQTDLSVPSLHATLSVVGLEIRRPMDAKLSDGLFMGGTAGTSLTLFVNLPDKILLGFDGDAGTLTAFMDDAGTDLSKAAPGLFDSRHIQQSNIAADGHRALTWIRSAYSPAATATKMSVKGSLVALCGNDLKTVRQESVSLLKGSKFKLGALDLELENRQEPTASATKTWISLRSPTSLQAIKKLRFLGADGKEIKSQDAGSGALRGNNIVYYTLQYFLEEKVSSATIEAQMWGDIESVSIPIDLEVGLGLEASDAPPAVRAPDNIHTLTPSTTRKTYLADFKEIEVSMGTFGKLGKNGYKGYNASGTDQIVLGGKPAPHGLSLHPPADGSSYVRYNLDGRYRTFRTTVGITDNSPRCDTPLTFRVSGDGKVLWESKSMSESGSSETCDISVAGVKELKLQLLCPGRNGHCYGVWVDPLVMP